MTENQIVELIERNKCTCIEFRTISGERLLKIDTKTTEDAIAEFESALPNFKNDYKKISVYGRANGVTSWTNGFCWTLDYPKANEDSTAKTIGNSNNGVGVMEMIGMMQKHTSEMLGLHKEIMELKVAKQNDDPGKWIPLITTIAPAMGMTINSAGMAGPEKPLIFEGVEAKNMNAAQIGEAINKIMIQLSGRISGQQMLRFVSAMNANPQLAEKMDNLNKLLDAIAKKPDLIDQAIKFI